MALYTVLAWTAIVIAGGAYYWICVRRNPVPTHLLKYSPQLHSRGFTTDRISVTSSQKRKRKTTSSRKRSAVSQTNDLMQIDSTSADETEDSYTKPSQQVQEESGIAPNKPLSGTSMVSLSDIVVDTEPPRKQAKHEPHFTASDADESDTLDTPTPAPSKKQSAKEPLGSIAAQNKNDAEAWLERITPRTAVDDMIPRQDRPTVARVLRIAPTEQDPGSTSSLPPGTRTDTAGPPVGNDGLTKKQRQNQKKKERHREARAREEAIRQSQLRAHQKELETIRLNSQIKAAEKRVGKGNAWQNYAPAMDESVYTIRNLSDDNLTTTEHRSDGAASEEGWQEVTSRARKAAAQTVAEKVMSSTDGSDSISSVGDSEEGSVRSMLKVRPAYVSANSFAHLDP